MELQPQAGGVVIVPMSREEFEALPDLPQAEWWDGCCVVTGNKYQHGQAVASLAVLLHAAVPSTVGVAIAVSWRLADAEFVPDLVVVRKPVGDVTLSDPPILGVEVLSPSTRHIDLGLKRARYAEAGLPWYWIVDLERSELIVLRNEAGVFVEVERFTQGTTTAPFATTIDVAAL
jgi:Uma2 family endonuclease